MSEDNQGFSTAHKIYQQVITWLLPIALALVVYQNNRLDKLDEKVLNLYAQTMPRSEMVQVEERITQRFDVRIKDLEGKLTILINQQDKLMDALNKRR